MNADVVIGLIAALGGSVVGTIAGWVASGLAVVNRVSAIEATLSRIELRLDNLRKEG